MTDEAPKPTRKRRRWIIAGVLLFAVGVACWWFWPRGDARFVGKWDVSHFDGEAMKHQCSLQLYRHGVMSFDPPQPLRTAHLRWRVEGGQLIWGYSLPRRSSAASQWIAQWMGRIGGQNYWGREIPFDILAVTSSEIQLFDPTDNVKWYWVLTRIPE
jgi:hypothetical protein